MLKIATLGPAGSDSCQAVKQFAPDCQPLLFNRISEIMDSFSARESDLAVIPIYNTREGEVKEYFRLMEKLETGYWLDNIVLPIHLSLGSPTQDQQLADVDIIIGRSGSFRQCEDFISSAMPQAIRISVYDLEAEIQKIRQKKNWVLIETESVIRGYGLELLEREITPHNRTRFAILGREKHARTGYDATACITKPLPDRVGLLVDTLNEFTRRGLNIIDLRSENDIKTQKLKIYLEIEGHRNDQSVADALSFIERKIIQEPDCIRVLGSFPRVDMRVKKIRSFGFIGSGDMSIWFAERLKNEGYQSIVTGRSSAVAPEEMIKQVDVVIICVPISVTSSTVKKYGPLLKNGQALILLAGESETPLNTALAVTSEDVEIMLVHNLWGPQTLSMKDKNVSVVRTRRSGSLCSEFESFLYKYGADINQDSAEDHDLMMGISQKLPTALSVALAMTLDQNGISCDDIGSHSTLTSLYGIIAMARIHNQNPRTYAEILATGGQGNDIVRGFIDNLETVFACSSKKEIKRLTDIIERNRNWMSPRFLNNKMRQAQAVDSLLSDPGFKSDQ